QDLTQAEVAEKLGKDQVFISNCESGRRRIDPIELLSFATAYGVTVQDLLDDLDVQEARDRKYGPGA
ncbi:MAG: helix-turn-helix domain-containing protein, partial [bacterium]